VKPENLAWKRRKHTLLDEIKQLALPSSSSPPTRPVDVLCVQELTDYWEFFKDELGQLGYASVYVKRPSIHGTSWSGPIPPPSACGDEELTLNGCAGIEKHDGCGIFFNGDRFKLVMEKSINYKDEHDRVALMVLLEDRQPSRAGRSGEDRPEEGDETETERDLVLVATTHLYWDATKVDDQMKQLREGTVIKI
jgi:mRNA deadenylase 3'-5' endonuclease subunit Ccr4